MIESTSGFQIYDFFDDPQFIGRENYRKMMRRAETCCNAVRKLQLICPISGAAFVVSGIYHIVSNGMPNSLLLLYSVSGVYPLVVTYLLYPAVLSCGSLLVFSSLYIKHSYDRLKLSVTTESFLLKMEKSSQLQRILTKVNLRSRWILGSLGIMSVPSIAATYHLFQVDDLEIILVTLPMLTASSVASIAMCAIATSVHHSVSD
ncbi:hypothetical protein HDE_08487 [Halotydeus destructor]|nr:hypothetical protein HDE_08487 [Halotydeus destructor]